MVGTCFVFPLFPLGTRRRANTISGMRSKYPMPFFPAHAAFGVLQADKLLFHFAPAIRAYPDLLAHVRKIRSVTDVLIIMVAFLV